MLVTQLFYAFLSKLHQNFLSQIRGNWSCENSITLQRDLKDRSGLKGWVMSDWGTCNEINNMDNTHTHAQMYCGHSQHAINTSHKRLLAVVVVTGATHSMSINEGLDQEMPGAGHMSDDNIAAAVSNTSVLSKSKRLHETVVF